MTGMGDTQLTGLDLDKSDGFPEENSSKSTDCLEEINSNSTDCLGETNFTRSTNCLDEVNSNSNNCLQETSSSKSTDCLEKIILSTDCLQETNLTRSTNCLEEISSNSTDCLPEETNSGKSDGLLEENSSESTRCLDEINACESTGCLEEINSCSADCFPEETISSQSTDYLDKTNSPSYSRDSREHSTSSESTRSGISNSDSASSVGSVDGFKKLDHFDKINQNTEDDLIDILNKNLNINDNQIQLIVRNSDLPTIQDNLLFDLSLDANIINGTKKSIERFMYMLSSLRIEFEPVYISNVGLIVFVKNITPQLIIDTDYKSVILDNKNPFFTYINQLTHFKSLQEIKLFIKVASSFCILRFSNHLDSNHLMENLSLVQNEPGFKNQFNKNQAIPLYANKYINRTLNNGAHIFTGDTLALSNLTSFFPPNLTLNQFNTFIMKFKFFAPIEAIYFPIINDQLHIGFIKFKNNLPNLTEICLRILLNLNNIDWKNFQLIDFSLFSDESEFEVNLQGLQVDFAQLKHNHHLLNNLNSLYLGLPLAIYYPNRWLQINNFSQSINYQETNLYVINIAQAFDNNNQLWLKFWSQFGEVNSAKLISRNNNKRNDKIGFVFYKSLNSALKALLKTNGKTITFPDGTSITIQSSFAIQKSPSYNFPEFDYYRNNHVPPMPMRNIHSSERDMELGYLFDEINSWWAHTYNQN